MTLTDVLEATPKGAGMGAVLKIVLKSDVVTCPGTPDYETATSYTNYSTISGDITFGVADGTGFYDVPVRSTKDAKMQVTRTLANADTGTFENTLSAFRVNANDPETLGFFKSFVGKQLVVLAQTAETQRDWKLSKMTPAQRAGMTTAVPLPSQTLESQPRFTQER